MAQTERFKRAQAKVGLLKGELARRHAENKSLHDQLNAAKDKAGVAAANAVSTNQSSAKMVALRQTIRDEAFKEAA